MLRFISIAFSILSIGAWSFPAHAEEFTTLDGDHYSNAIIKRVEPDGLLISYPDGVVKLRFKKLPDGIGAKYGYNLDSETVLLSQKKSNDGVVFRSITKTDSTLSRPQAAPVKESTVDKINKIEGVAYRPTVKTNLTPGEPQLALVSEPIFDKINKILGLPIFSTNSLWQESDNALAERLRIPKESKTSYESSFRKYTTRGEEQLAGCRTFATTLIGDHGHPVELSFMLANKGDIAAFGAQYEEGARKAIQDANRQSFTGQLFYVSPGMSQRCEKEIRADRDRLTQLLTSLLGTSRTVILCPGSPTAERGQCWAINDTSLFLGYGGDNYIALRILPSQAFMDAQADRKNFMKTREELPRRIIRRDNGDVYLEMPMIDQGPKGFCVPATLARVLRYYGLRGDMDVIAKAANSSSSGGTSGVAAAAAVYAQLINAGAHIIPNSVGVFLGEIKAHIEQGQPIIWGMWPTQDFMNVAIKRNKERESVTDWNSWRKKINSEKAKAMQLGMKREMGHYALIIGYNQQSGEVAISSSWGEDWIAKWVLIEEARAVTQSPGSVIAY
jgi:Peptidase_C39 like family